MCCGQVGGVVGVVGGFLVLLGLIQLASGICFLLILPIFQLGSNIWTGSWSGVCGLVLGVIGWKKQTIKRGQLILVATLSVLVANVANLVILQVGEYGVFLTTDARRNIVENNLEYIVKIAFWLTTIVTALGIVISFFGAQYLFCVVVRGPKMKGRLAVTRSLSEEGLHHRQEAHDSTPALDDVVALPDPAGSSAWVYHPDEDKNPTPLYPMGLDLLSDFPDGSRRLPARHASFASTRYARVHQRPQRAQSLVVRRDMQISESQTLRPPRPVMCPEPQAPRFSTLDNRSNARRIYRSNSVNGRLLLEDSRGGGTLSHKFHACSLDDLDSSPVIEVGVTSLERSRSEQSLISIAQESTIAGGTTAQVHRSTSVQERLLDGKMVLTSFGPVNRPLTRITKPKGPAPPPPIRPKPAIPSVIGQRVLKKEQNDGKDASDAAITFTIKSKGEEQITENTTVLEKDEPRELPRPPEIGVREPRVVASNTKRVSTLERPLPLPVIEENIKNTRKRPAPQPRNIIPSQSDDESSREMSRTRLLEHLKSARHEVIKPPRPSLAEKPLRLVDRNMSLARPSPVKKPERKRSGGEKAANLRRLEEVLTNILDHGTSAPIRATKSDENIMESLKAFDTKMPKSILKKGPSKPSKYEVAHREALEDSKALLDQLPRGELQRNKIVLRVPSFRTAGCQTEAYRPIRRRASCAQTNLSVVPRFKENTTSTPTKTSLWSSTPERWTKPERRTDSHENSPLESSSSSSGYSSPEVGSKDQSPAHSGPPSPASSSVVASDEDERRTEANVTVIEVNKSETVPPRVPNWHGLDPVPPPRPPKPLRLRHMSDAAVLMGSQGGLLVPVHRRASQLPTYEDVFGLAALTENVMLLTEAINPVLVRSTRHPDGGERSSTMPRVVDVIRKINHQSHQDDKPWDGRTTLLTHPRPAIRTHSLSLPRPSLATSRVRQQRDSRPPSPSKRELDRNDDRGPSTAAYLASLELLASHYRHQALANAKQLQLQQQLLIQQQRQQQLQRQQQQQQQQHQRREDKDKTRTVPQPPVRYSIVSPIKGESEC